MKNKYHPLHYADFKKSGLSDETILAAGFKTILPANINKIIGCNIPGLSSAYEIPYPGCDGFSRYRLFYEDGKKGHKYIQQKGTGNHLYILGIIRPLLHDTSIPLYKTEGEKKALKACQEGLICVGLSGLWNWSDGKKELIADFEQIALAGRQIFIVPDNDYLKPNRHGYGKNLKQAVYEFAYRLIDRGAKVSIVELPDGQEKGLDDYLLSHSVDEFRELPVKEVRKLTVDEIVQEVTLETLDEVLKQVAREPSQVKQEVFIAEIAKKLEVKQSAIKKDLKQYVPEKQLEEQSIVENIEPWETPVNGYELLNNLYTLFKTHVVLDHHAVVACVLWIALTYCHNSFGILPILAITSPEKRCGKTTLLEIIGGLVNKQLLASSITPSAIFRTIEKYSPCLLIDEADTFIKDNDELRGILNSGHTKKSAFVIRTNLVTLEPERFSTWGPKAVSLIGALPDTLSDRSIAIRMERKTVSERVKRVSLDFDDDHLTVRRMCKRWAIDNAEGLKNASPRIPDTGNDRATDNWLPLISIADIAGKEWSDKARKAMLAIETVSDDETITQTLLRDVREILGTSEKISSAELVDKLIAVEDHPWGDWRRGKPITQNGLARLLKPFGILSRTIRIGDNTAKGYVSKQFADTFNRYLPPIYPIQSVTTSQLTTAKDLRGFQSATQEDDVTVANLLKPTPVKESDIVTDGNTEKRVQTRKQLQFSEFTYKGSETLNDLREVKL